MNILMCAVLLAGAVEERPADASDLLDFEAAGKGIAVGELVFEAGDESAVQQPPSDQQPPCDSEAIGDAEKDDAPSPQTAARPDWIDQPLTKTGSEHFLAVSGPPRLSDVEARLALEKSIVEAVRNYVDDQVGRVGAGRRVRITIGDVRKFGLEDERFAEDRELSVGRMKVMHARLKFGPDFRDEIATRWKEHLVAARLTRTGLTVGGVMLLLIVAFGFLKSASSRR